MHVVVFPDGFPIEIQIRTQMQHEWAEMFEKVADVLGRGIRYGEPPQHWLIERAAETSGNPALRDAAQAMAELPKTVIVVADVIDVVERAAQENPERWPEPAVKLAWTKVADTLDRAKQAIDRISSSSLTRFSCRRLIQMAHFLLNL